MDNQSMEDRRVWRDSYRFSLTFQMIGLVLLLLFVCTILVRIYAGVMTTSLRAEATNKGVLICRNAGELFTERGNLEETVALLGASDAAEADRARLYFDRDLNCVTESEGWLTLELKANADELQKSGLRTCDMEVTYDGAPVYHLTVQTFVPEERV
jgi:hypothetical protein